MKLHWTDKYDDLRNWSHLEVHVIESNKPNLTLQSGVNSKFKLINIDNDVFWGRMDSNWAGVWFLRNDNNWSINQMIIPPINSNEIESIVLEDSSGKGPGMESLFCNCIT